MENRIMRTLKSNFNIFVFVIFLWIILGLYISYFDTTLYLNYIYVISVNFILFIEVLFSSRILSSELKFKTSISGLLIDNQSFNALYKKFEINYLNIIGEIASVLVGIAYIILLVLLEVLKMKSVIFFYGVITLVFTVYIAIRLYLKYVIYVIFLREISIKNLTGIESNIYNPAATEWICNLSIVMRIFNVGFAIMGILYTIVFYLTTPKNAIRLVDNSLEINTANNGAFIISWLIIVVAIGIGYIILDKSWKYYIKKIIKTIKYNTLKKFSDSLAGISDIDKYKSVYSIYDELPNMPELVSLWKTDLLTYIPTIINVYHIIYPMFSE